MRERESKQGLLLPCSTPQILYSIFGPAYPPHPTPLHDHWHPRGETLLEPSVAPRLLEDSSRMAPQKEQVRRGEGGISPPIKKTVAESAAVFLFSLGCGGRRCCCGGGAYPHKISDDFVW